jgi:putative peptide zinc metalloprotease protein
MDNDKQKPIKLPPLRAGITVKFNDYDKSHKPQWVVHDPARNKFLVIGWQEYEILQRWGLEEPALIVQAVNSETTLNVDEHDIESIFAFLKRNHLLKQSGYQIYNTAKEQKLFKDDSIISWLISHYLFFRIPLVHPDRFLDRTKKIGVWFFNRYLLYTMVVLGVIALYLISTRWDDFSHSFPELLSWKGLSYYFIVFTCTKLLHELGHAYMAKRYGVPVPTLGVAFLVFWPVLYTDTTLSWHLKSHQRMNIALAGIWMETYVVIIAALIWYFVDNEIIQTICFITITVNWMASLLINVSPFMRFDGYFILADYLSMPNLQPRAFALTRWQLRRWFFGWTDEAPEHFTNSMRYFLVGYSLFTWIYRLILYIGIAVLVYHFFFKLVGILLFFIEVYYFILAPFVSEIHFWIQAKDKFVWNRQTKLTTGAAITAFLIVILPISETVELPATLSYTHQFIFAPDDGVLLTKLPLPGTRVIKNQTIAQFSSAELSHSMQLLILEYQQKLGELRRSEINAQYVSEKNILLSDINQQQAQYKKLYDLAQKLNIKAPFDGILIDVAEINPGQMIQKDTWIGDVVQLRSTQIEAFVSQVNIKKVHKGSKGYFYPHDFGQPKVAVKVDSIENLNMKQLNCYYSSQLEKSKNSDVVVDTPCYHASDFGGEIPTFSNDQGILVPVDSIYRVVLTANKVHHLPYVEAGKVVIDTERSSYLGRFIYHLKTVFIQELEL